ncbi:MAG: hypothetical protein QOD73_1593, partial [Solirubrobacteraceae bacterium]|nr:hypothetical protein [Solirubrobacteraceae bacterium]
MRWPTTVNQRAGAAGGMAAAAVAVLALVPAGALA